MGSEGQQSTRGHYLKWEYTRPHISCGVPQGAVLGSELFIAYINDIVSTIDKPALFAGDTNIFHSGGSF